MAKLFGQQQSEAKDPPKKESKKLEESKGADGGKEGVKGKAPARKPLKRTTSDPQFDNVEFLSKVEQDMEKNLEAMLQMQMEGEKGKPKQAEDPMKQMLEAMAKEKGE